MTCRRVSHMASSRHILEVCSSIVGALELRWSGWESKIEDFGPGDLFDWALKFMF